MSEKKNVNLPILCVFLLIIITGAVGYLYYRVFFQMPRDIVFCAASQETLSYQLFDNQFSHILTTITILIAMFGLAIPLATCFFQQKNLEYERQKIKDEIDELKNIKENFPEMQKDFSDFKDAFPKMQKNFEILKTDFTEIRKNIDSHKKLIKTAFYGLSSYFYSKLCDLSNIWNENEENRKSVDNILNILISINNLLYCLFLAEDKCEFSQIIETFEKINTISVKKYFYEYGLNKFLEKYPQEKDYVTREQIADLLGKDSKEYEKIISLLSWIYDVYDKQLKDSSDA